MQTRNVATSPAIWNLFGLYIIFLVLLPSGSVYGVNVKILTFVPLALIAAHRVASEKTAFAQYAFAAIVLCLVTAEVLRSSLDPFYAELGLSQAKDVITTLAGCLFVRLFTRTTLDRERFLRLAIYTVVFGSFLKLVLLGYSLWTGASVSDIVDRIGFFFGVKLMAIDIKGAGGRLELPSDNLLPIVFFAIIALRKRLKIRSALAALSVALLIFSSLYTFSRFIWGSVLLAALLGVSIARRDKIVLVYVALTAAATAYFFPVLSTLVALRFSDALAGSSDIERVWQISALKEFFWEAPFFGHGIGSYILDLKRSADVPYAYEVQIAALFCQFGLVGMGFLICLLINYYRKVFDFPRGKRVYQLAVLLLLLDFIAAGMFNPDLIVSMSAVSYGMVFVMALIDPEPADSRASSKAARRLHPARVPSGRQALGSFP
jgi:hypothetical protein